MSQPMLTLKEVKQRLTAIDKTYEKAYELKRQAMTLEAEAQALESSLKSNFPGKFTYISKGRVFQHGTSWEEPDLPTLEDFYAEQLAKQEEDNDP